jgi:Na+-translocating ferredoxin:NAD+ oxidoreductase subunit B
MNDVYQRLAEFLDTFPQRFPVNTDSGIELKVLEYLFTPEEAEMALRLQMMPETPDQVAARIGADPVETEKMLYAMSGKGQIMRMGPPGGYMYMAMPFFVGIYEFQLKRMDRKFSELMEEFKPVLMSLTWLKGKTKEIRTVPVNQAVDKQSAVMSYEIAEEAVMGAEKVTLSDCICRKQKGLLNKTCSYPIETCLSFNMAADFYAENGLGRPVSKEEALDVLKKGGEAGLVLQLGSSKNPSGLCMCCGCCCAILEEYKKLEKPAREANSNFFAQVDHVLCTACGTCVDRCQMGAISIDDVARINLDRCIGCGACAVACPTEAVKMIRKSAEEEFIPQNNMMEAMMAMYQERR